MLGYCCEVLVPYIVFSCAADTSNEGNFVRVHLQFLLLVQPEAH